MWQLFEPIIFNDYFSKFDRLSFLEYITVIIASNKYKMDSDKRIYSFEEALRKCK